MKARDDGRKLKVNKLKSDKCFMVARECMRGGKFLLSLFDTCAMNLFVMTLKVLLKHSKFNAMSDEIS